MILSWAICATSKELHRMYDAKDLLSTARTPKNGSKVTTMMFEVEDSSHKGVAAAGFAHRG